MIELTDKEKQILALTDGRPMSEIAKMVGLSTSGVKFHSDSLRKKLGVKDRWMLIALREKYVTPYEKGEKDNA